MHKPMKREIGIELRHGISVELRKLAFLLGQHSVVRANTEGTDILTRATDHKHGSCMGLLIFFSVHSD